MSTYQGYTETEQQIHARWERMKARAQEAINRKQEEEQSSSTKQTNA